MFIYIVTLILLGLQEKLAQKDDHHFYLFKVFFIDSLFVNCFIFFQLYKM